MRAAAIWLVLAASGCTHQFLERQTLHTASTLNNLQTQQVMDNLAVLCANPEANPWHVTLSAGLVQATDQGTGVFLATFQDIAPFHIFTPSAAAERSLTEQWSLGPVIDGTQLETLQIAYNKAVDPTGAQWDDKVRDQIVDLCVRFTLLPSDKTLLKVLENEECVETIKELRASLKMDIAKLHKAVSEAQTSMRQEQGKTHFELYMKKAELEDAIAMRKAQMAQLRELCPLARLSEDERRSPEKKTRGDIKRSTSSRNAFPTQGINSVDTSDTTLLILTALQRKSAAGYLPTTDIMWESVRNPALVDQAEDQIAALEQLLGYEDETRRFKAAWLYHSMCKKDVPPCACAVGHATVCGHECFVWVLPQDYGTLQRFTRIVMTLTVPAQQDITTSSPTVTPTPLR